MPARPVSRKKNSCGFLDLPGELRNQIYGYCFQQGFQCDFAGKDAHLRAREPKVLSARKSSIFVPCPGKDPKKARMPETSKQEGLPISVRVSRTLGRHARRSHIQHRMSDYIAGHYQRINGLDTCWETSLCPFFLVCKKVYSESIGFLYENTTFGFDSPSRITRFLNVVSKQNLSKVRKIQLYYHTYGDPKWIRDVRWQERHRDSWSRACKAVAKQLINLNQLHAWIHVHKTPIKLNMQQDWIRPFFWFRQCREPTKTIAKSLTTVNVQVESFWSGPYAFDQENLCGISADLHRIFGQAIASAILGASEDEAMEAFSDAWESKYAGWKHHLRFASTDL